MMLSVWLVAVALFAAAADADTAFKLRKNYTTQGPHFQGHKAAQLIGTNNIREQTTEAETTSPEELKGVVWPVRIRCRPSRFRLPTPTTSRPQPLLKLLQPRRTRPAIYSLDGFVPRPARTTVAPISDLQALDSAPSASKRQKAHRINRVDEESDERKNRKQKKVSRWTAFARKGIPGKDFPALTHIPHTNFDCGSKPGLYADPDTGCQVWHMCPGGRLSPRHSFLCPNGTIFSQKRRICDWWYNVRCRTF